MRLDRVQAALFRKKESRIPAADGDVILKFSSDTFVALSSDRSWFVSRDEMDDSPGEEDFGGTVDFRFNEGFESSCQMADF